MDIQSFKNHSTFFPHQSDFLYEMFFDSSPIAMGIIEIEGNEIRQVLENKASEDFFHHKRSILPSWVHYFKAIQDTKESVSFEFKQRQLWFTTTLNFLENLHNGICRYSYFIQDITFYQQKVKERHDEIQAVFQSMHDGIVVFDLKGDIIFINEPFAHMYGHPSAIELEKDLSSLTRDYQLFFSDHTPVPDQQRPFELIRQGKVLKDYELRVLKHGQSDEWYFSYSGRAVFNAKGKKILMVCVVRDITQQKSIEEHKNKIQADLEQAIRARDEFLSIASHELKTPLTSLKLQTQLEKKVMSIQDDKFISPRLKKYIHRADIQIQRLNHLVEDMLDISSIASGRLVLNRGETDLLTIVQEAQEKLAELIAQTKTEIIFTQKDFCRGDWDKQKLEQVVMNLLTNAMKYGGGNPIEIELRCEKDGARLKITDSGLGIIQTDLERIFNRFERSISANEVSGLGLGLYISRQIIALHGGEIKVESQLGHGSIFTVTLPSRRLRENVNS